MSQAITERPVAGESTTTGVAVRFDHLLADVHGGASGMLYGSGDSGVPTLPLLQGVRSSSIAQKAPGGAQHPTGDASLVADNFFAAGGREIQIYLQDDYEAWPYENLGIDDYANRVERIVALVAQRADRDRFSWVPFNEPDWIWFGDWSQDRARFFESWSRIVKIIRAALPDARIVGPNHMNFEAERLHDFLEWANDSDLLPQAVSWHELRPESLAEYPAHYAQYRAMEAELGFGPLAVSINEYGNRRDFSVPGRLIQWLSMFESTGVDADLAFWTYAGNLDDHAVRGTEPNAGWWLLKWYADLDGRTASVTRSGAASDAIAVLDERRSQATILVGGAEVEVPLRVSGLTGSIFGAAIDVTWTALPWSGYEGSQVEPAPMARTRLALGEEPLDLAIPGGDPLTAYRITITPAEADPDPRRSMPALRFEAEDAEIVGGAIRRHDDDPQKYTASGGRDVADLTAIDSRVIFSIAVPASGAWTLSILYGSERHVGRQLLTVDGTEARVLEYPATLSSTYRGKLQVELELAAGPHTLAFHSSDANGLLDGCDVSLDRIDLTPATRESTIVTARQARVTGAATFSPGASDRVATVDLASRATATWWVAVERSGYCDLSLFGQFTESSIELTINGERVLLATDLAGRAPLTVRAHLTKGVSTVGIAVRSGAARISHLTATPGEPPADAWLAPSQLGRTGSAQLQGSDGVALISGLENGSVEIPWGSTGLAIDIARELVVRYGNSARNGDHEYNTDVVSAKLFVVVGEQPPIALQLGPTHASDSFAERSVVIRPKPGDSVRLIGGPVSPTVGGVLLVPLIAEAE